MERARCIVPKEEDLVREANKRPNNEPNGLTNAEILMIVNGWIGGEGGYLGRFSYRTHNEFWLSNCDLYVDTNQYKGTTRQLFTETLSNATSYHQADAIEALLEEYDGARDEEQNQLSRVQLVSIMNRLRSGSLPDSFDPGEGFVAVARAIDDVWQLTKGPGGYQSAVDRMHTALHGYLRATAGVYDLDLASQADIVACWKSLVAAHPAFANLGLRHQEIHTALKSMTSSIGTLIPIRNNASNAHPNDEILEHPEAVLVVNMTHTIALYVRSRINSI